MNSIAIEKVFFYAHSFGALKIFFPKIFPSSPVICLTEKFLLLYHTQCTNVSFLYEKGKKCFSLTQNTRRSFVASKPNWKTVAERLHIHLDLFNVCVFRVYTIARRRPEKKFFTPHAFSHDKTSVRRLDSSNCLHASTNTTQYTRWRKAKYLNSISVTDSNGENQFRTKKIARIQQFSVFDSIAFRETHIHTWQSLTMCADLLGGKPNSIFSLP